MISIQEPETEEDVLKCARRRLEESLPADWTVSVVQPNRSDLEIDGVLTIEQAAAGRNANFQVEVKRLVTSRDLAKIREQFREARAGTAGRSQLLVAKYLARPVRESLRESQISYIDATGNIDIEYPNPLIVIRERGADKDPWRGPGRPAGSLQGKPAANIARALADCTTPMTMPQLAKTAGTSTGASYRVVEFLENEGLLERQARGPITRANWRRILEAWSKEYSFQRSNTVQAFIEPRGTTDLLKKLANSDLDYAVTGSLAAGQYAPYAEARLTTVYVRDIEKAQERLNLRPAETGINVLLARPAYDVVFARSVATDGVIFVAPSQAAVDLLTGPGRNPAEATALFEWMERNEDAWRR